MTAIAPGPEQTTGWLNYIAADTPSSLYRNGRVRLRRDLDGNDDGIEGFVAARTAMPILDARRLPATQRCTLDRNGFELLARPLPAPAPDFMDQQSVLRHYYPACAQIVSEASGGRAFVFDHNLRSAQARQRRQRIAGGQQVQEPIHVVHGDYTLTSGPQRLRDLARPPGGNDTLRTLLGEGEALIPPAWLARATAPGGRFAIINLWRSIGDEPVAVHPLALCDGRSVRPEDLVVFELHYSDRIGENYFSKPAARHRWAWYPGMTRDEALLIKQWDSAGTLARSDGRLADGDDDDAPATFSFHSAFEDPAAAADAPDRRSIEVRCLVIYR